MGKNTETIERFYTAFARLDARTMNDCYTAEVVFSDPVFMILKNDEVRSMWEMLCKNAKDFKLTFSDIEELDEEYATVRWTATYTFSKTGRKVTNKIKAFMKLKDGLIVEHSDAFRLSTWIGQALGWKGVLFGWTGFMKRAVQKNARKSLEKYMVGRSGIGN
ncbi:MAG TPA: nuclear transport factor 2 family protein [Chitinophagaceae bacterium]|nr:nuclear transport factor 2 family protein [Chitinophagaceae bacterium]